MIRITCSCSHENTHTHTLLCHHSSSTQRISATTGLLCIMVKHTSATGSPVFKSCLCVRVLFSWTETLTQLEVQWKGHHFPFVNNALETWNNAVKTLQNALSDGYDLRRLDINNVRKSPLPRLSHDEVHKALYYHTL